jgi:hypothetical protein
MASSQPPGPAFRLRRPDQEFAEFAGGYIQRMLVSRADFDEGLYREACDLVLGKLQSHSAERGA